MSRAKRKATIFQNIGRNQSFNEVVENIYKKDLIKEIIKYADLISERSGQIIRLFLAGYTFEEMGKMLHLSKQNVNQIFNRAVKKIKHKQIELS